MDSSNATIVTPTRTSSSIASPGSGATNHIAADPAAMITAKKASHGFRARPWSAIAPSTGLTRTIASADKPVITAHNSVACAASPTTAWAK